MTAILIGSVFIIVGVAWVMLVLSACSMASRPTDASDAAPALLGVVSVAFGITLLIWV